MPARSTLRFGIRTIESVDLRGTRVATDGGMLYLVGPAQGIVTHTFAPERACP